MSGKRILLCEFHQESNTFNPINHPLRRFYAGKAPDDPVIYQNRLRFSNAVHGMTDAITEAGGEVIPVCFLSSSSGGRVEDEVLQLMCDKMEAAAASCEFDAICVSLHGATCTVSEDDACGVFLRKLRKLAGNRPIAASFDLHANITGQVAACADIVCGYQSYPHTDYYQTGYRAAALCMKKLQGEPVHMAVVQIPMLVPPAGYTSLQGAFCDLMNDGKARMQAGELLDFTLFPVQPWLDIPEIASTTVAIADSEDAAREQAMDLAQRLYAIREEMQPDLVSVDDIIDIAEANTSGKPVLLVDSSDSPNGGAVGDSPVVAMRLLERGSALRTGIFVRDPAAVEQAFAIGIGGSGEFTVGSAYTPDIPGPLKAVGTVRSLHDGVFTLEGPASRGSRAYLGRSAVVSFGSVDILLCTVGAASGDPQLFRHFGIEPTLYDLIVIKANTSFRVPYKSISDLIYLADTPGAGASNLKQFIWRHLPDALYPFDAQDPVQLRYLVTK